MMSFDSDAPLSCARGHMVAPGAKRCASCYAQGKPGEIGDYALFEPPLGRGAHGTVYKAREAGTGQLVALKVIKSREPDREVLSHVRLAHPNIVPIFNARGLYHDPPFFTMQLIEGGTLASRRDDFSAPDRALELMIQVSEAIEYAHQHRVLHRDLKPTNILIDPSGRALVTDFSVAKEIDGAEPAPTETMAGTLPYMSPEQAGIGTAPVSTASDVYGLGAILYELLTGRPPRPVETLDELRASFMASDLPPPIERRGVSAELAAVCMRALIRDPKARYRSAALLTADLRRVRDGEWLSWRPPTVAKRVERWVLRNTWVSVSIAVSALILTVINVETFHTLRRQQTELRQIVLKSNAALAKAQAQAALAELAKLSRATAAMAQDFAPQLEAALIPRGPVAGPEPELHPAGPELNILPPGFDSVFVAGCDGFTRSHSFSQEIRSKYPSGPPGYFGRNYRFRDYFRGGMELAARGSRDVYVSRSFRSTWDGRFKFGFATPIYPSKPSAAATCPGTDAIGILLASRPASSTLGDVQIPELAGSGQRTALFGPRDRESPDQALPDPLDLYVLVHEQLRHGEERRVDTALSQRLSKQFAATAPPGAQFEAPDAQPLMEAHYRDMLGPPDERSLAGFYPVGRTGLLVGVATAFGKATQPLQRSEALGALNVGFLLYCLGALWLASRRSAARGGHPRVQGNDHRL